MNRPPTTPAELGELLDILRSRGVSRFRDAVPGAAGFEVEFFATTDITPEAAPTDEPRCACGHQAHEHGHGGLCLLGCEPDVCAPDKEEQPK